MWLDCLLRVKEEFGRPRCGMWSETPDDFVVLLWILVNTERSRGVVFERKTRRNVEALVQTLGAQYPIHAEVSHFVASFWLARYEVASMPK
ncbi:hypothetical protein AGR1B_pa0098 [Agrobacterium fabacearum S56]|nr:hypothetical protein AGR1B_pa0098 [Agrobacterium fabacearum S56]